jgi:hypothetical protein
LRQRLVNRYLRLLCIVVTSVVACSASAPDVRDGDIIFQTSLSSQSVAIQRATHSKYSHMGLIVVREGTPYVLEASATVRYILRLVGPLGLSLPSPDDGESEARL